MSEPENHTNIPKKCPKCGEGAFWREAETAEWKCYYCDPPPVVRRLNQELS